MRQHWRSLTWTAVKGFSYGFTFNYLVTTSYTKSTICVSSKSLDEIINLHSDFVFIKYFIISYHSYFHKFRLEILELILSECWLCLWISSIGNLCEMKLFTFLCLIILIYLAKPLDLLRSLFLNHNFPPEVPSGAKTI